MPCGKLMKKINHHVISSSHPPIHLFIHSFAQSTLSDAVCAKFWAGARDTKINKMGPPSVKTAQRAPWNCSLGELLKTILKHQIKTKPAFKVSWNVSKGIQKSKKHLFHYSTKLLKNCQSMWYLNQYHSLLLCSSSVRWKLHSRLVQPRTQGSLSL